MTNSASIISALESLQCKIKELELNREKTLLDLEDVSKRARREGMGRETQTDIKELELNREKTLLDLEDVSKRARREGMD